MYEMKCVYVVDVLLALIHLPLDPMSVEVLEEMVDVFRRDRVSVPFADVEGEEGLIGMSLRLLNQVFEVSGKKCD